MALTAKEEAKLAEKEAEGFDTASQRAWLEGGRLGEMPPPRRRGEGGDPRAHRTFKPEPADAIMAAINEGKQGLETNPAYEQALTNNSLTRIAGGVARGVRDAGETLGTSAGELITHPYSSVGQMLVGAQEGLGGREKPLEQEEWWSHISPAAQAEMLKRLADSNAQADAEAPASRHLGALASQAYLASRLGAAVGPALGAAAEGAALPGVVLPAAARTAAAAGTGGIAAGGTAALSGGDVPNALVDGMLGGAALHVATAPATRAAGMLADKIRGGTSATSADIRALENVGARPTPVPFRPAAGGAFENEIPEAARAFGQGNTGADFRGYVGNKAAQGILGDQQRQVSQAGKRLGLRRAAEGLSTPEGPAAEQIGYQGEGSKRIDMTDVLGAVREAQATSGDPAFFEKLEARITGQPSADMGDGVQMRRPVQPRAPRRSQPESRIVNAQGVAEAGDYELYPSNRQLVTTFKPTRVNEVHLDSDLSPTGEPIRSVSEREIGRHQGPRAFTAEQMGEPISIRGEEPVDVWDPTGKPPRTASAQVAGRPTMTVRDAYGLLKDLDEHIGYQSGQTSMSADQIPGHKAASALRERMYSPETAPRLAAANQSFSGVKRGAQDLLRQFGYKDPAIESILKGEVTEATAKKLGSAIANYGGPGGGQGTEAVEYLRTLSPAYRHAIDLARAQLAKERLSMGGSARLAGPGDKVTLAENLANLRGSATARGVYPAAKAAAKPRPGAGAALIEAAEAERERRKKKHAP